ncbi:hypothetical protein [Mycolicibacter arupensis]|uniref:hypothetical protein n=1 Tax=Mycolicibacter arupensis TaxID=342002 RepID=UPI003B3B5C9F
MLCCLVAGSLMAMVFRIRMWLTRRRPGALNLFAPPARRSAGGEPVPTGVPAPPQPLRGRDHRTLRAIAAGVLLYVAVTAGLLRAGVVHSTADATTWAVRTALWSATATALSALAWRRTVGRRRSTVRLREQIGCALAGVGVAWFVLGVADTHLFDVFALGAQSPHAAHAGALAHHHASTWWDIVFHGSGAGLAIAGWLTLPVRPLDEDTEPQVAAASFAGGPARALGRVP